MLSALCGQRIRSDDSDGHDTMTLRHCKAGGFHLKLRRKHFPWMEGTHGAVDGVPSQVTTGGEQNSLVNELRHL